MTSALERGSRKVDKSTDKLRDHVCDKGGTASLKSSSVSNKMCDGNQVHTMAV